MENDFMSNDFGRSNRTLTTTYISHTTPNEKKNDCNSNDLGRSKRTLTMTYLSYPPPKKKKKLLYFKSSRKIGQNIENHPHK